MQRLLAIILPFAILLFLGVGGSIAISSLAPEPEVAPERDTTLSVFVEPAMARDVQLSIVAQGSVKPVREIAIAPQISGKIEYMSPVFQDGGAITAGQLLVRLEQVDYKLALISARASVASAAQRLVRERAEGQLALKDLQELGFDTASDLALRKPQLAEAQAALDSAEAQLANAELALARTEIRAPFDGLVAEKTVDLGQFVGPGQTMGRVFDTSAFEVFLPIQDQDFAKTGLTFAFVESEQTPGPAVKLTGTVRGAVRMWSGRVVRTGASINAITRQIGVFVRVDDPFGVGAADGIPLPSGLFVDAEIFGEKLDGAVIIPRSALRSFNKVYVATADKGLLDIREVAVAQSDGEEAIIRSGVMAGEYVVTSLIDGPTQDMPLRLLKTSETGGSAEQIPLLDQAKN